MCKSHVPVPILDASHAVLSSPSGTRLTGWTSSKRWWRRTRGSWRIWATCADRCASWRSATPSTCSAPASWRRSFAGPTLSAVSWTPTRDRQAVGRKKRGRVTLCSCVNTQVMLNSARLVHVSGKLYSFHRVLLLCSLSRRLMSFTPSTQQRPWKLRNGSLSTRTFTTSMTHCWRRKKWVGEYCEETKLYLWWEKNDRLPLIKVLLLCSFISVKHLFVVALSHIMVTR